MYQANLLTDHRIYAQAKQNQPNSEHPNIINSKSQNKTFINTPKRRKLGREEYQYSMEKDIPIPHPTETPKEKNFDMKRETPIHVSSHLKVRLTRSILTKHANLSSILQNPEQGSQSLTIFAYRYIKPKIKKSIFQHTQIIKSITESK